MRGRVGLKIAGDDARDEVRLVAEGDGAADEVRVGAKAAEPEGTTDDRDASAVGAVLVGGEAAAEFQACAEEAEVSGRHVDRLDLLGPIAAGEIDAGPAEIVRGDVFEYLRLLRQEVDGGYGVVGVGAGLSGEPELDNAVGVGVRKRAEKGGVDEGEDGGVGADTEGKSGDGGDGEGVGTAERSEGLAELRHGKASQIFSCRRASSGQRSKSPR